MLKSLGLSTNAQGMDDSVMYFIVSQTRQVNDALSVLMHESIHEL